MQCPICQALAAAEGAGDEIADGADSRAHSKKLSQFRAALADFPCKVAAAFAAPAFDNRADSSKAVNRSPLVLQLVGHGILWVPN